MLFYVEVLDTTIKNVSFDGVSYDVKSATTSCPSNHIVVPTSVVRQIGRLNHRFQFAGAADADGQKYIDQTSFGAPPTVAVPGAIIPTARRSDIPGSIPGEMEAVRGKPATGLPGDPTASPAPVSNRVPTPAGAAIKPAASAANPVTTSQDAPGESPPVKKV